MSLLRHVLKPTAFNLDSTTAVQNGLTSKPSSKGGGSFILPVNSKRPKRRKSDVSCLGAPVWYDNSAPEFVDMPGTEPARTSVQCATAAHGHSVKPKDPWLSIVLFHYGCKESKMAEYYEQTKVRGEVRTLIRKSENIASIDVWVRVLPRLMPSDPYAGQLVSSTENAMEPRSQPFHVQHVNLWKRSRGSPCDLGKVTITQLESFEEPFPRGSYVFPFEFEPFPKDIEIRWNGTHSIAKVPFPPTYTFQEVGGFHGSIQHRIRVNIQRDSFGSSNEVIDLPIHYLPRRRPIPQEITPFPSLPTRHTWPCRREIIGGWTITPFGCRGLFQGDMVEIEGLLGVPSPEVHYPGSVVSFVLQLWSSNVVALAALCDPKRIEVTFTRSDMYGRDVLRPTDISRHHRVLQKLSQGRIWKAGERPSPLDELPELLEPKILRLYPIQKPRICIKQPSAQTARSRTVANFVRRGNRTSRLQQVSYAAPMSETKFNETQEDSGLPATPNTSLESLTSTLVDGQVVKFEGDVLVTRPLIPSFRYHSIGCEYALVIMITHPEYSLISPVATSISAETPIWVVSDPPRAATFHPPDASGNGDIDTTLLPISGHAVVQTASGCVRAPTARGVKTAGAYLNHFPQSLMPF